MKKLLILFIVLALSTMYVTADHAMPPVPETQGAVTSTTIDAIGNFASATEFQWRITDGDFGLPGTPPLGGSVYESVYTEDTVSNGIGLIAYDKELDVETSGQISGQWNIEAVKELAFVGIDGARVASSDVIFVDGASLPPATENWFICPFVSDTFPAIGQYCNRAEAGSTIDMTVANVRTTSTERFVMPRSDHPVELNHDIRVSELVEDLPSIGMASAYIDALIQEGDAENVFTLQERIESSEETTVDGDITLFEKLMHYESGVVR
ncbi:MAG TPA: hypothetical protein VMW63_02755 [Methanoregulaceae archaeon]|nr:hypothetical protein [Methanoregulaceae archaeon]